MISKTTLKIHNILTLSALIIVASVAAEPTYPHLVRPAINQRLTSPDKKYTVWLSGPKDDCYTFNIQNNTGKSKPVYRDDIPTTVSALYWTGDSKTIIGIILLAGGPVPYILHINKDNEWQTNDLSLPLETHAKDCLTSCLPLIDKVRFTFGKITGVALDANPRYFNTLIEYNPETKEYQAIKETEIPYQEYLKTVRNFFLD